MGMLGSEDRTEWLAKHVLPHETLIRAHLSKMRVGGLDVDDVIQEMYARMLSAPALDTISYPRQYAIQVARGIVIDHVRRSQAVPMTTGEDLDALDIATPDPGIEERLAYREDIAQIVKALARLPKVCRDTLILRRVMGMSQKEAAQRLGVTEKVIEHSMARGVQQLVKVFGRGGKPRAGSSNSAGDG